MIRCGLAGAVLAWTVLCVTGCARGSEQAGEVPPAPRPFGNTDPCAMRLHDLSGTLLAYWARHYEFPESLGELTPETTGFPVPPTVCPVSARPYVYTRDGILLPERQGRVIVYDPAPAHAQMRWVITVEEPEDSGLPITKVIALPERFFLLRPPG